MNQFDIVRAWKDPQYRSSLGAKEQALLPEHPAGSIELDDSELGQILGGDALEAGTGMAFTAGCCGTFWICDSAGYFCPTPPASFSCQAYGCYPPV